MPSILPNTHLEQEALESAIREVGAHLIGRQPGLLGHFLKLGELPHEREDGWRVGGCRHPDAPPADAPWAERRHWRAPPAQPVAKCQAGGGRGSGNTETQHWTTPIHRRSFTSVENRPTQIF